jgi:hypothetical protein
MDHELEVQNIDSDENQDTRGEARPIAPIRFAPVSGLYECRMPIATIPVNPVSGGRLAGSEGLGAVGIGQRFIAEPLRLDVDGRYPQHVASGSVIRSMTSSVQWIANLTPAGANRWTGTIWYKDGNVTGFPYTTVEIHVAPSAFPAQHNATAKFSGGGGSTLVRSYKFSSGYFHSVDFEFDSAEGEQATIDIDTHAHPNHPGTIPAERLSIQTVYQRAGFDVTTSPGGPVPIAGAGVDAKWSNQEMHDAMQTYWSRFAPRAQWAMWVFFASLHESGTNLGGIMFDDIGPNHRQGTAIFNDSFIANPPAGDPAPAAWVRRMLFWTACHEMGHAFNLAHAWQKALGTPWIPLTNTPEARSFMNYPYKVAGGQMAFFQNFEFRFDDSELLFMRHAPNRFVQMGNADWFDHHAFEGANVSPEPALRLEVRVNRNQPIFEFLEPPVLELKLTNTSPDPQTLAQDILLDTEAMTVIVKKDGKPARRLVPYARYCRQSRVQVLAPTESLYESLFVGAGRNGWDLAEPGNYTVQIALRVGEEDIVSNPLRLRVRPPQGYDEEVLAQDFFSDDVGRVISFDGSRFFDGANDTLREISTRFADRLVAIHARIALGTQMMRRYKRLGASEEHPSGLRIEYDPARAREAVELLDRALVAQPDAAAGSLGHVDYRWYSERYADWLAEEQDPQDAARVLGVLLDALTKRSVGGRPVRAEVLREIGARKEQYGSATDTRRSKAGVARTGAEDVSPSRQARAKGRD